MFYDVRLNGYAVAFTAAGELALAAPYTIVEDSAGAADLFHVGRGGLQAFVTNAAFQTAYNAGSTIVAVCTDPDEAVELRARVKNASRSGIGALLTPA